MERINNIIRCELFINTLKNIEKEEKARIYCKHGIEHLFDTARICYIINLEESYGFEKEIIYAAALLHDIGRYDEYKNNIPHNRAGAEIAGKILDSTGFSYLEKEIIVKAILNHRKDENKFSLGSILRKGDRLSRKCFLCSAENSCYWSREKKNFEINY